MKTLLFAPFFIVLSLFANDFVPLQWHLKNTGQKISVFVTFTQAFESLGLAGEDLNIIDIPFAPKDIKIAVIDSGLDLTHPDLKNSILYKPEECAELEKFKDCLKSTAQKICVEQFKNTDVDGNGYILDCHGQDFSTQLFPKSKSSPLITDSDGHGTHVAGLISAKGKVLGAAPLVQILPIKVALSTNSFTSYNTKTGQILEALKYAISERVDIINFSLGWRFDFNDPEFKRHLELADELGIIVIAAGGNSAHDAPVYPCAYETVLCVGSYDNQGNLSAFSNFGPQIDLLAPGSFLLSTWPQNIRSRVFNQSDQYEYISGTSQSTPLVTALTARLLSQGLSVDETKLRLRLGTRPLKEKGLIRHGKVDYQRSLETKLTSLVEFKAKGPILYQYFDHQTERSFVLALKNKSTLQASNIQIKLIHPTFQFEDIFIEKLAADEVFEKRLPFSINEFENGQSLLKLHIHSDDEDKVIMMNLRPIHLITPDADISNTIKAPIVGHKPLSQIKQVRNFVDKKLHFFGIAQNEIYLLVRIKDKYFQSRGIKAPKDYDLNELRQIYQVDLSPTQKQRYILLFTKRISQTSEKHQFVVVNTKGEVLPELIAPKNTYQNDELTMPGIFDWIVWNGKKVPAWIGFGTYPKKYQPKPTPFNRNPRELKGYGLFLLTHDGLDMIEVKGKYFPLKKLYSDQGFYFIATNSLNYSKEYKVYKFDGQLEEISDLRISPYHDLSSFKDLECFQESSSICTQFFGSDEAYGLTSIKILLKNNSVSTSVSRIKGNFDNELIQFWREKDQITLVEDAYHLVTPFDRISKKVTGPRRSFQYLEKSFALFLPGFLSPGVSGEIIRVDSKGKFYSRARENFLSTNGCQEVGLTSHDADYYTSYCNHQEPFLSFVSLD